MSDRPDDDERQDDAPPAEPEPEPKKPITLSEMAYVLAEEAYTRGVDAKVLEKLGEPLPDRALRAIEVKWACARFLDMIAPILPDIKRLLKSKNAKKTGNGAGQR